MLKLHGWGSETPVSYESEESPIRLLEELALTALPALQTAFYDGWVLRFADGYTRRANSINPVYESTLNLESKIRRCERLYNARRMPTVFKLTPLSYPSDLDHALTFHHYKEESGASVQTSFLTALDKPASDAVTLSPNLSNDWLSAYFQLNRTQERYMPVMRQILSNIVPQKCFTALYHNQAIVAVALGVLDQGYLGVFDVVVDAEHRRQGLGEELMLGLLNWGKENGAQQTYLQVRQDNAPALHLYEKLGFQEIYQYWYRTK